MGCIPRAAAVWLTAAGAKQVQSPSIIFRHGQAESRRHGPAVPLELRLEFKASVNADSGLFIRGPQLQVRDYLVAGPYKKLKKYKPQDWNEIVVIVKGTTAHCECNGEVLEDALKIPADGGIGLEADRNEVDYRNIRLTKTN